MNRWKIATIILLLACIALAGFYAFASYRLAEAESKIDVYAKAALKAQGYAEGTYQKPDIPDAPQGSKPLLHASGSVRYAPIRLPAGAEPATNPGTSPQGPVPALVGGQTPCRLEDLDVTINCTVDAMAEPGKPFARLLVSGQIKGWDQIRELPETPSGEVTLQVAKTAKPKTWGLDLLAGAALGSRPGVELGLSGIGRSRFGWYAMAEYQFANTSTSYDSYSESYYQSGYGSAWSIHGGLRFRVR